MKSLSTAQVFVLALLIAVLSIVSVMSGKGIQVITVDIIVTKDNLALLHENSLDFISR